MQRLLLHGHGHVATGRHRVFHAPPRVGVGWLAALVTLVNGCAAGAGEASSARASGAHAATDEENIIVPATFTLEPSDEACERGLWGGDAPEETGAEGSVMPVSRAGEFEMGRAPCLQVGPALQRKPREGEAPSRHSEAYFMTFRTAEGDDSTGVGGALPSAHAGGVTLATVTITALWFLLPANAPPEPTSVRYELRPPSTGYLTHFAALVSTVPATQQLDPLLVAVIQASLAASLQGPAATVEISGATALSMAKSGGVLPNSVKEIKKLGATGFSNGPECGKDGEICCDEEGAQKKPESAQWTIDDGDANACEGQPIIVTAENLPGFHNRSVQPQVGDCICFNQERQQTGSGRRAQVQGPTQAEDFNPFLDDWLPPDKPPGFGGGNP